MTDSERPSRRDPRPTRRAFRLSLFRPGDVVRDVDEEIAFHLAMREARLRADGVAGDSARHLALERFGDLAGIREACLRESHPIARRERAMRLLEELRRDVHLAIRSLRRAKAFAAAVVVTLALGIGANATIFALTDAVVLRPVTGVREPERLFELAEVVSYPLYRDLAARAPDFRLAAVSERRVALGHGAGGGADHTIGAFVSGSFFAVAGVGAALGRTLGEGDDVPGAPPVAVLTH
jgi:putative ABC transport system permease protein